MKKIKNIIVLTVTYYLFTNSTLSFAHCTGYHPHHCSVGGVLGGLSYEAKKFREDVTREAQNAWDGLDTVWKDAYHQAFPESVRSTINQVVPLAASLYFLGVDPTTIATATTGIIAASSFRAKEGKEAAGGVTWKEELIQTGNEVASSYEINGALVSSKNEEIAFEIQGLWNKFLDCMSIAQSKVQATSECFTPFKRSVRDLIERYEDETMASAI